MGRPDILYSLLNFGSLSWTFTGLLQSTPGKKLGNRQRFKLQAVPFARSLWRFLQLKTQGIEHLTTYYKAVTPTTNILILRVVFDTHCSILRTRRPSQ
jgi:hypothetical protein